MKKLLLILLCLPLWGFSQNLPIVLSISAGGDGYCDGFTILEKNKYIDRREEEVPVNPNASFSTDPVHEPSTSSALIDKSGRYNYNASNLADADFNTAWAEGEDGYGIGEFIEFDVGRLLCLTIYNGYQKSIDSWKNNSRVKIFKVYLNNTPICFLELEDVMSGQSFDLGNLIQGGIEDVSLRFEISKVYSGNKWKDVCISDILVTDI